MEYLTCAAADFLRTVTTTSQCPIVSLPLSPLVTGTLVPVGSLTSALLGVLPRHDTTTSSAPAPLVSLPLSPLVTGTIVPVQSITSQLGNILNVRGDCKVISTTTITTTVKPTCQIVNPGSL